MSKRIFEIEKDLNSKIRELEEKEPLEVDGDTLKIIESYKEIVLKQKEELEILKTYKERELDAFSIGDAVSDGICIVDNKGIVIAVNKGYTEITGIREEELVGKSVESVVIEGYFDNSISLLVIEQKKKITSLATVNNNNKVLITGNPIFDENGEVIQVLTVMRDLTELLKLKDEIEMAEKKNEKYLNELNYYRSKFIKNKSFIGESVKIREIKELISYVAKTEATILITGETGCGKEIIAKEIHEKSDRKDNPYIKVNCAAIPESLIESELFGYEKGSFTGALNKEKLGMFEIANGGTLLLDEIGEMPMSLQSKLLRVLQEKELTRVGGTKSIKLDVRVIASTNCNLEELIRQGKFREDLFYRLNVLPIKIPPLRERKSDIKLLINAFVDKLNTKYNKQKKIDSMAIEGLEYYDWPGNVRELQNIIERLIVIDDSSYINYDNVVNVLGKDKINFKKNNEDLTLKEAVETLERQMIEQALRNHGSTYKAAKILGVAQPTVFRKAKALGIKLGQDYIEN
ncbi:sigma-54 interaction domain-containing protein [Clostridium intestinale]|uniref:sigma-54 interaction domain-containing protein n=1 Tax=Clostridium intestinale TaxID=36845 RepID=UPI002DD64F96|nr:sigma 54-interacting transcriptional regulator [Clostridium intestinale]WRY51373.1 sigma 54-interacting transcriptional regulator [Clostridium intestinale]